MSIDALTLAHELAYQTNPITHYQLQKIEYCTQKITQISPTPDQLQHFHNIWEAISQNNSFFTKNFIFCFSNTNFFIVKFYLAKLLNLKIYSFWEKWKSANFDEADQIFNMVVNCIIYLIQDQDKNNSICSYKKGLLKLLNISLKMLYRFQWNGKLTKILSTISTPQDNPLRKLKNNLLIIKFILEDASEMSKLLLQYQRYKFMEDIKMQSQLILRSIITILSDIDSYKNVALEAIKVLPHVLLFINQNLFLSNYSSFAEKLINLYCQCNNQEAALSILESVKLIVSFPTDKLMNSLACSIDMRFAKNINRILQNYIKKAHVTKSKQTKIQKPHSIGNMCNQRKSSSFSVQQKQQQKKIVLDVVQNIYCSQYVTNIDWNILQVILDFLSIHKNIEVEVPNQTVTIADRNLKQNKSLLQSLIQNLVNFLVVLTLKLQNYEDQNENIVEVQRKKLFIIDAIKRVLVFTKQTNTHLSLKPKLYICSMLMCNLSTCPSQFWHTYAVAKVLPHVNLDDESNFDDLINEIQQTIPDVWKNLVLQIQLVQYFTIQKLTYYLALPKQTSQKPDRILGVNRLVWGVKHLIDTSRKKYNFSTATTAAVAVKFHKKILNQTDINEDEGIKLMASKFCQPFISENQEQQSITIQNLFIELDSVNSYKIQFNSLLIKQIMNTLKSVQTNHIQTFLNCFQNLILYQDKNDQNLVILDCLLQFLNKMRDRDISTLTNFIQKMINTCLGQQKQYPQRTGFIKMECLTWILKMFFVLSKYAKYMMQTYHENDREKADTNYKQNKSWTNNVCYKVLKCLQPHIARIFKEFSQIKKQIIAELHNYQGCNFFQTDNFKKQEKLTESFIDFMIAYSRAWKCYLKNEIKQNKNFKFVSNQIFAQQQIFIQVLIHQVGLIETNYLTFLSLNTFKFFASFLQFYCDVLIFEQNLYPNYKLHVNQIIRQVYQMTNSKIATETDYDLQLRLNYYQFFERVFSNKNIFCVLDNKSAQIAISDILIKICLDDCPQIVETGIFILEKLFIKIIDIQSERFYQQIWNSIIAISTSTFHIMLIQPGRNFFDELSTILLHLILIVTRSQNRLFENSGMDNALSLRLVLQKIIASQFFQGKQSLDQEIKDVIMCLFNLQQIGPFREKVRDLLIITKRETINTHMSMNDCYQSAQLQI